MLQVYNSLFSYYKTDTQPFFLLSEAEYKEIVTIHRHFWRPQIYKQKILGVATSMVPRNVIYEEILKKDRIYDVTGRAWTLREKLPEASSFWEKYEENGKNGWKISSDVLGSSGQNSNEWKVR